MNLLYEIIGFFRIVVWIVDRLY